MSTTKPARPIKEQLLSSMNAKETHTKAKELISREAIVNTPFELIGSEEKGYFIGAGQWRFTEPKPTREESLEDLNNQPWMIIANMIAAFTESFHKINGNHLIKDINNSLNK